MWSRSSRSAWSARTSTSQRGVDSRIHAAEAGVKGVAATVDKIESDELPTGAWSRPPSRSPCFPSCCSSISLPDWRARHEEAHAYIYAALVLGSAAVVLLLFHGLTERADQAEKSARQSQADATVAQKAVGALAGQVKRLGGKPVVTPALDAAAELTQKVGRRQVLRLGYGETVRGGGQHCPHYAPDMAPAPDSARLAVLIDGDNTTPTIIEDLLAGS